MKISTPSVFTGSLGQLLQELQGGKNLLSVLGYGNLGQIDQQLIGGRNLQTILQMGYSAGANFLSNTLLTANTAEAMFTAAANTNGAILWRWGMRSVNTGGVSITVHLVTHTAAPVNVSTGSRRGIAKGYGVNGTANLYFLGQDSPIFVPAGSGAYFISGVTESEGNRFGEYTLL